MTDRRHSVSGALSAVEGFFDRLKLSYKWRFDRWEALQVVAYRGYGTRREVSLHGRVLDDQPVRAREGGGWWRNLRATYPELPFVLVGDSGQQDPEIFRRVVEEAPERIAAVYLRDVTPPERDREVRALGEGTEARGVPWVLVETTAEAAEHAAGLGLVTAESAREVAASAEEIASG